MNAQTTKQWNHIKRTRREFLLDAKDARGNAFFKNVAGSICCPGASCWICDEKYDYDKSAQWLHLSDGNEAYWTCPPCAVLVLEYFEAEQKKWLRRIQDELDLFRSFRHKRKPVGSK